MAARLANLAVIYIIGLFCVFWNISLGDPFMELLQQRTAQLAAVRDIGRAIAEAQDLKTALDLIARNTTTVMAVDSCSIYLYDEESQILTLAASTGLRAEAIGKMTLPVGTGLTGWAVAHAKPVAVADALIDPRFQRLVGSGESQFKSLMAMPLIARNKVIGAVNVQTYQVHNFSEYELELFGFIADLAATALEKAKLVHAAVVQEIHHRVKNNLQTMAMLLRLQVDQAEHLTAQDILHETISRILSIAAVHEILSQEMQAEVGLKQLVEQVARVFSQSLIIDNRVQISVQGDDVRLSSQMATNLALVANELLQNALEHGLAHQDEGVVTITLAVTAKDFLISVADNGRGLPADFDFEKNQGLGLQLVYTMVVEDMAGDFKVKPGEDGGTKADVRVPLHNVRGEGLI